MVELLSINDADIHRNGVSGDPFYTGIVITDGEDENGSPMLVTVFPPVDDEGEVDFEQHWTTIAVVSLDKLPEHGVKFGVNSWRGDRYSDIAKAIVRHVDAEYEREHQELLERLKEAKK